MANEHGLSSTEARKRLAIYGPNEISTNHRVSWLRAYIAKFKSPLVIILLLSAVASLAVGQSSSGIIIIIIVFISTTLDFVNSYRSEKAAQALQSTVKVKARVLRDNKLHNLNLNEIVPGDLVALQAGNLVPADAEVLISNSLTIDESAITGESFPATKSVGNTIYMGCSVASGDGWIRITKTGIHTEYAHIAGELQKSTVTKFDVDIARFSALIARLTFGLVIFIMAINLLTHRSAIDALMFALALAVGLTPELLPLIITANLTKGAVAMAKRGVIVKHITAIQNFGSMDILCTDKTGTLTQNRIQVVKACNFYSEATGRPLKLAAIVCRLTTSYENPMDLAILNAQKDLNTDNYTTVQEIPYDFTRKRESIVIDNCNHERLLICKGAADTMLDLITAYRDKNSATHNLTAEDRRSLRQQYEQLSSQGYRVLMVASRSIAKGDRAYNADDENELTFEGYISFVDPPKPSAKKSLAQLAAKNIQVKIITGDDPLVASHVASELGIDNVNILSGSQIDRLNDTQLARRAEHVSIFARVTPSQKLRIIKALRLHHTVGYMGDGINDAPSLRAADVSISVSNATDVAKDTADIILHGKSLDYLNDGVVEGRRTFANTVKYLQMALSSNFGNMISMAGASLFLPYLPMTAPQILLNNLLYDSSQLAIPSDNVDEERIRQPQRLDLASLKRFMIAFGLLSSVFDLITFAVLLCLFHATAASFQTAWFIESLLTQVLVVFIIRTQHGLTSSRPSKSLIICIAIIIAIALAIALTPLGQQIGFIELQPLQLGIMLLIVVAYLASANLLKRVLAQKIK